MTSPHNGSLTLATPRLSLVAATVGLARAELHDRAQFAQLLRATVPENWPPESAADALPLFLGWLEAAPDQVGWFGWYALADPGSGGPRVLVAGGGFLGPPDDGVVQIGYSVLAQFQGLGYATEMVGELIRWALAQPDVACIAAETEWANPASVRVLEKCGLQPTSARADANGMRFERRR